MISLRHGRFRRASRSPAPVLALAVALASVSVGLAPDAHPATGNYFTSHHPDTGLPTGTVTHRGLDLQGPDRDRDRGTGGVRYTPDFRAAPGMLLADSGLRPAMEAPEGLARRALQRAGRLSAPGTAPPAFS
jgi:hypothetical protein